jgi:hypothetical protein
MAMRVEFSVVATLRAQGFRVVCIDGSTKVYGAGGWDNGVPADAKDELKSTASMVAQFGPTFVIGFGKHVNPTLDAAFSARYGHGESVAGDERITAYSSASGQVLTVHHMRHPAVGSPFLSGNREALKSMLDYNRVFGTHFNACTVDFFGYTLLYGPLSDDYHGIGGCLGEIISARAREVDTGVGEVMLSSMRTLLGLA